ncbi:MAG: LysR family transcriptional regulator [Lachnospirales bacterium]
MTLQQLRYVIAVAENGTVSGAAKSLFISQPSLTNAIRELEKELQINIFLRTNKGVVLSNEGSDFIGYARQIIEQADLLEDKYINYKKHKKKFSVSTQHYSFAVNGFVDVIKEFGYDNYDFTLRETQTYEILQDVSQLKCEVGILYLSSENEKVITKIMNENNLIFEEIVRAKPHIFISSKHPLANNDIISFKDLEKYPFLQFEQGEYNSFHFFEELYGNINREKTIKVRDRATLFNLAIGLNGYTISSGIISKDLNGENIISRPLDADEEMRIGFVTHKNISLSNLALAYMDAVKKHCK